MAATEAADPRSMAWRGAALLASGTPRAEAPRAEPATGVHGHFRTAPPPDTHEAWMGTTYARWVERGVHERLEERRQGELAALQRELDEEQGRHAETARSLDETRERLKALPRMQAGCARSRRLVLAYALREADRSALVSSRATFQDCFRAWSLYSFRCALDRARNPRPSARGLQPEAELVHVAATQQWHTLKHRMAAALADYAEADTGSRACARARGRALPRFGLGATSADEARSVEVESPVLPSPWYPRLEDSRRPPASKEQASLDRGLPGPLSLAFDTSVQRSVPPPSVGGMLRDRALRWTDLPCPQGSR